MDNMDKKVSLTFVIALIIICGLISVGMLLDHRSDKNAETQMDSQESRVEANITQLSNTQNMIIKSVARLEFIVKQLAEGECVGQEITDADKAWSAKVDAVARQSRIIKHQKAEIEKLQTKLKELEPKTKAKEVSNEDH